jgi:hypothetical protein
MIRTSAWSLAGGAAAALTAVSLAATPPQGEGSGAEYSFRAPLVEGRGVASLEDLRGKPVLIDFWGTR